MQLLHEALLKFVATNYKQVTTNEFLHGTSSLLRHDCMQYTIFWV